MLIGTAVAFRQPLGDWLWPDTRIQQLIDNGNRALAQGRLTAADGSGARELFNAALALDSDRNEARDGLVRTGVAALVSARRALQRDDLSAASSALALARDLQVPQLQSDELAAQVRQREVRRAGLDELLQRALTARQQGHLDDGPDSALALYRQVLELSPDRRDALEGREDALADLLLRARTALGAGELAEAAVMIASARSYDAGHVDLPATEGEFNRRVEQLRARADRDLHLGRLQSAAKAYRELVAAKPNDTHLREGMEHCAEAFAVRASRLAADFHFGAAQKSLAQARELAPGSVAVVRAERAMHRARVAQRAASPRIDPARRERELHSLLARMQRAEANRHWLTPPGNSAYDALRAAQAIAPRDRRVLAAAKRIVPATRQCFEDELRDNRLHSAEVCLDAWGTIAPADNGLGGARRRLAQRWIAVGSEQLGGGDAAFAREALAQARQLDPATPELPAFAGRVNDAYPRHR